MDRACTSERVRRDVLAREGGCLTDGRGHVPAQPGPRARSAECMPVAAAEDRLFWRPRLPPQCLHEQLRPLGYAATQPLLATFAIPPPLSRPTQPAVAT